VRKLLPLVLAAALWVPAARAQPRVTFAAVVEANFARWDRDHDGRLSPQEVTALVTDPEVRGDEAAAVAAIHLFQRGRKDAAFTRARLLRPDEPAAEERRDQAPGTLRFEARFEAFRARLGKVTRDLFAGNAPSLEGLSQGHLGDCYCLAAVGAAVHRHAAGVKGMFRPLADGSCDVALGGGRVVHVRPLTDAEVVLGSTAGDQGVWLNVLEEAFGQLKGRAWWPGHGTAEGLDAIARGGDADEAIKLLTGHRAKYLAIRKGAGKEKPPPARRDLPALEARVRAVLRETSAGRALVCCGTSRGRTPPGIPDNHDFALLGYDTATDSVLVWNPWGNHFTPRGRPGLGEGYPTEHGQFRVPLVEFVRIFDGLYYESVPSPGKKR
jgi:hypothetical protein